MDFDLLSVVQPEDGWTAIVGINSGKVIQRFCETREEADAQIERFNARGYDVYFGVAKFCNGETRTKQNVLAIKSLWADLDCGPGKGYANQAEAFKAVRQFVVDTGLPKPVVVNSGRGLHLYWPLSDAIPRTQWEPLNDRLKALCVAEGLQADLSCFEASRILRVPGTFNYKGADPLPVEVMAPGKPTDVEDIRRLLGVARPAVEGLPFSSRRGLSPLAQAFKESTEREFPEKDFSKILARENGCAQLKSCYEERETLSEPRWFNALSIAKHCRDHDTAIHVLSEGHPDYDPAETERKIAHISGPHSCRQFEASNPGGCKGCPHKGKITSPIQLGVIAPLATPDDNEVWALNADGVPTRYVIPEYPFPYARGKNGGIWWNGGGPESEPEEIYPYDLYVVKRMRDPVDGGVVLIRSHSPMEGVEEFTIPTSQISVPTEVGKALARWEILMTAKKGPLLIQYIILSAQKLRGNTKVEHMRNQFGWADSDSKFIIGDREISAEGVYHSPPSSTTRALAEYLVPSGTLEKWKEVFNLYGRPGMEAAAFAAATAFGAPLLRFSGQRGAIINLVNTNSGTGKTTALYMCNSVWGHPEKLCAKKDDTFNSKVFKLGVFCNLPVTFDEMSNTEPKQLSELAYLISQGSGKDRMKASTNELRINNTSWQTIALCSSNHSFYEKLEFMKNSPQGETMRIIEYPLDYSDAIDMELGKEMFDHQLHNNYGHAGGIYAKFLVENKEKAVADYLAMQRVIDATLKLTQKERFWSAQVAANISGMRIAHRLGLIDWDIARIFKWACRMMLGLRKTITPPIDEDKQLLSHFILQHVGNILVIDDQVDKRSKMALQTRPLMEPKQELMVRFEPDTKKLFIVAAAFNRYCTSRSISYRETLEKLKKEGIFKGSLNKHISKGLPFGIGTVRALEFDGTHSDFEYLHNVAEAPEDESVGG